MRARGDNRARRNSGGLGRSWRRPAAVGCALLALLTWAAVSTVSAPRAVAQTTSPADGATRGADNLRTSWYPDQTNLTPSLVSGGTFGQRWDTDVNGSVYGQPLYDDGQVLVNTENNYAYGVDPATGAILWSRDFGTPTLASAIGGVGCSDLAPNIGMTGTAVVDQSTDIEYVVDDQYTTSETGHGAPQGYFMQALELDDNGAEAPGFPVEIQGPAQNNPNNIFDPELQLQRPGLLLLGGVVYVAFGSHCDIYPWQGWIAGVTESGALQTMWTTMGSGGNGDEQDDSTGAGIWQSGGGLVSDGPNTILFSTGNISGPGPGPIPGDDPPADLGESVVRVDVEPNGTLEPVDFFSPTDNVALDSDDLDFGSGAPVALPDQYFGTSTYPSLAVAVGKEGYVYLLNRDNLGGVAEGPNGSDDVVGRFGPNGGVWSSPAVWPGDGGWIYVPTASESVSAGGSSGYMDAYQYGLTANGVPTLNLAGQSSEAFGYGSSGAVVTSNGTTSGSAVVWTIWSPNATGEGAELQAYDPVPVDGVLQQIYSAPIGTASKFNPPGVGDDMIFVGTRDGQIEGFGAPVAAPVTATPPTFPNTVVGQSSTETVTLTASSSVTIDSLTVSGSSAFTLGTPSATLPDTLASGGTITVPVTFAPTEAGEAGAALDVTTPGEGSAQIPLSALGEVNGPNLVSTTLGIDFGGIPPGDESTNSIGFTNNGSQPLTISGVTLPTAPFSATGAPSVGQVIQPGSEVFVDVNFAPTTYGSFTGTLQIDSNGGDIVVTVSGDSTVPSLLEISPMLVNFGNVPVGQTKTETFTLTNVGGTNLEISKSKPPALGQFNATTQLDEGSTIDAGTSVTETVAFTPSAVGSATDGWVINPSDGQGVRTVTFVGTGVIGDPSEGGWTLNGSSKIADGGLQLTAAKKKEAGSAFAPVPVSSANVSASFTSTIGEGKGAGGEGLTLVLADPSDAPTSLGSDGGGLGFSGISGVAVALVTEKSPGDPSSNFVGVTTGPIKSTDPDKLKWLATSTSAPPLRATDAITVSLAGGDLTVSVNGTQVLSTEVSVGPNVLLGFTGSTGSNDDVHAVSGLSVDAGGPVTVVGDPATSGGWTLNGSAALSGDALQLTQATQYQAGTAFWPTPVSSSDLTATFTTSIGGGTGADGLAFVLADADTAPTSVGAIGGGLGFSAISGTAVALDTYQNAVNPSSNFVGVTNGPISTATPDELNWLATNTEVPNLRATNTFTVTLVEGTLTVTMDGTQVLSTPVTVGPEVLLGFSGGTGLNTDVHSVSDVSITAAPAVVAAIGDPTAGGWTLNGSAVVAAGALQLTQVTPGYEAGSAFWPTPVDSSDLTATFTASIGGGTGADGMTFFLGDGSDPPTSLGYLGGGLGFSGIPGVAVALDTYLNANNPSDNFVGVSYGPTTPSVPDELDWVTTNTEISDLEGVNTITVNLVEGVLTVSVDGTQVLSTPVNVGPTVLVGFTGGTGSLTDDHSVSNAAIVSS